MLISKIFKRYIYDDVKFFLLNDNLVIMGKFGKLIINLSYLVFIKNNLYSITLLFVNKHLYITFFKFFTTMYSYVNKLFFLELRLKGLGFRTKRIHAHLVKFFFAKNYLYYFYVPNEIYLKIRKRNFFMLCFNKSKLNEIFHHFMLLKKMDLYEKTKSFVMKDKIIFLKKKK